MVIQPNTAPDAKILRRFLLSFLIASAVTVILGRISTQCTTLISTDVAFPEWAAFLMSFVSELIVCTRIVLGYAALACAAYRFRYQTGDKTRTAMPKVLTVILLIAFADYLARFLIDLTTGAILGVELMAAVWVGLQFVYESIFIVLSMLLILSQSGQYFASESTRGRERHSPNRAVRYGVLLTLASRIVLEIYSIIEFLLTYTDVTNTEISSMVGSVLKVAVIYGGAALILGEVFTDAAEKRYAGQE